MRKDDEITISPRRRHRLVNWQSPPEQIPPGVGSILKLFVFLTGCSFTLGTIGYFSLRMIMPHGWVFGALYRMFLYHWEYPLHYIGLVSLVYSTIATSTIVWFGALTGKWPRLMIFLIMLSSILVASPLGGILWVIQDMQAGYFLEGSRFWEAIEWGVTTGINMGWLVILLSIPYNIFGLIAGYQVTLHGYRMTLQKHSIQQPAGVSRTLRELNRKTPDKTS